MQYFDVVHLAYAPFPADPRVRREALATRTGGRRVAVVALGGEREPAEEEWHGLTVIRLSGRKARGGPLEYLTGYGAFTWRCRRLLARDPRCARVRVVHVHTLPDFLVWAALPAQRRGARVVLDLHEILPEFVAAKYPGVIGRLGAALARRVERWARRRADLTITVNQPIDELLAARGIGEGRSERRIVIHNSSDPEDFGPPRPPAAAPPLPGPEGKSVELVYHGTLTPLYGVDLAIRGLADATRRGVTARLTVLGDGPAREALGRLTQNIGVAELVTFEAPVPATELPRRLGAGRGGGRAGIVPTRLDPMTRYSLSNKLLEYVHLGLPVLAARLPSYARYLPEDAAWFWTANDATDLGRVIAEFAAASAAERAARARRAQDAVAAIGWPLERARLEAAYEELLRAD
jgi:glycosyltransferase involved in cell wall biosynthesis